MVNRLKFSTPGRWRITDILIAVLSLLTALFYIFSSPLFKLFFAILVIAVFIRLLMIIRRRLFWKIRNRLIFSGLFFVVTPLLFITLFFYIIGTVVVAQYGTIIISNIMEDRLNKLENLTNAFLRYKNAGEMATAIFGYTRFRPKDFIAVLWRQNKGIYKPYFQYPETLDEKKIVIDEFEGYFLVNDKLFHGVLRKKNNLAALLAIKINQGFFDGLYNISDFRLKYRSPNAKGSENEGRASIEKEPGARVLRETDSSSIAPTVYSYTFIDFNATGRTNLRKRQGEFMMSMDYSKIYRKIVTAISASTQGTTKKFIYVLIALFGTFIIISFIIGFRMIRVITRSVNQITKGTQRIRNGDFSFRIKTRSGDQLQYLAESFNEMASGINRLLMDEKEKQRLEEELRIARSIQLKLLPPDRFHTEEFEIAAVNIPAAEIAGDYFDYFYKKGDYLSLLVADVSGKGASAAFYMAELKGVINHLLREIMSPAALVSECNESMKHSLDKATFITMNLAQFRIPERKFLLTRAGHTRALFFNAQEKKCAELFPEGVAIGLINFSRDKIKEVEIPYREGDILFLFSDGLSEIMNEDEEMLGIGHLKRILCENHSLPADEIKQKMLDFSIQFSDSQINRDDLTFIILKVK